MSTNTEPPSKHRWTAPFHGISHLGELSDARRATVDDRGSFVELTCWYRGCGFLEPFESTHATVDAARAAGELWIKNGVHP